MSFATKTHISVLYVGVAIATAKCSLPFDVAFVRGILCNWLVCMAVYMASGCASLAGKMVAVWFPISAFVALGLDHSVANMFIVSYYVFYIIVSNWTKFTSFLLFCKDSIGYDARSQNHNG